MNQSHPSLCGVIILVSITLAGCGGKKIVSTKDAAADSSKRGDKDSPANAPKPDFTLTAAALAEEHGKSKSATIAKYKGKTVEIQGTLRDVARDSTGDRKPYLELEGGGGVSSVFCYTAEAEPWLQYAPGMQVTVRGRWPDFSVLPTLEKCVVLESAGTRTPEIAAQDLAEEANDADGVEKIQNKRYIVRGEIAGKQDGKQVGTTYIGLRARGTISVYCAFDNLEKDEAKSLTAGRPVRVYAVVRVRRRQSDDREVVELSRCILLK